MKQYLDLLNDVLVNGNDRDDRTKVGTKSVFGRQIRFDMTEGFPAITTKKLAWKAVVSELLWFLEGSSNEHRLAEIRWDNTLYNKLEDSHKKTIWTLNSENQGKALGYENGELGRIYGYQWRRWNNQLCNVIEQINRTPTSRRLLVSAWNVSDLDTMALPPCHYAFQFYVDGSHLSLMWNQRSVDICCGLPFNIASYALLLCIVAKMTNKIPLELIGNLGDCHVYKTHLDGAKIQLNRTPHELCTLKMPDIDWVTSSLDEVLKQVKTSDFVLENYVSDETIKYEMAV